MLKSKVDPRAIAGGLLAAVAVVGLILNDLWYVWLLLLAIGVVLISVTITDRYDYECQKCHRKYKLGIKGIIASKHGRDANGSWAISRCPHCRAVTKAKESRSHGKEKV
jgi:hypothetical protein